MKLHFKETVNLVVEELVIEDDNLVSKETPHTYNLGEVINVTDLSNHGSLSDLYFSDTAAAYNVSSSSFEILPDQPEPTPKKCCGRT